MREEVQIVKRTCDICGYGMVDSDDNPDVDLEFYHHWFTAKAKWFDEYNKVHLKIIKIEVEEATGLKEVKQCCTSCLHKLLGTDDGK